MPKFITVGATDATGEPIKTRAALEEALTHNPRTVRFFVVELLRRGKTVFNGSDVTDEQVFVVSGPDAFHNRAWTCHVRRVDGKVVVV